MILLNSLYSIQFAVVVLLFQLEVEKHVYKVGGDIF